MSKSNPPQRPEEMVTQRRYSLPDLLREVQNEREASSFGMDRLDQSDINRVFTNKRARRALKSRK